MLKNIIHMYITRRARLSLSTLTFCYPHIAYTYSIMIQCSHEMCVCDHHIQEELRTSIYPLERSQRARESQVSAHSGHRAAHRTKGLNGERTRARGAATRLSGLSDEAGVFCAAAGSTRFYSPSRSGHIRSIERVAILYRHGLRHFSHCRINGQELLPGDTRTFAPVALSWPDL